MLYSKLKLSTANMFAIYRTSNFQNYLSKAILSSQVLSLKLNMLMGLYLLPVEYFFCAIALTNINTNLYTVQQ